MEAGGELRRSRRLREKKVEGTVEAEEVAEDVAVGEDVVVVGDMQNEVRRTERLIERNEREMRRTNEGDLLDVGEEAKGEEDESWEGWWQEVTRGAREREDQEILRRLREQDVEVECIEVGSEVAEVTSGIVVEVAGLIEEVEVVEKGALVEVSDVLEVVEVSERVKVTGVFESVEVEEMAVMVETAELLEEENGARIVDAEGQRCEVETSGWVTREGAKKIVCELVEETVRVAEVMESEVLVEGVRGEVEWGETEEEEAVNVVGTEAGAVEKTGCGKLSHNDCRILYAAYVESKMWRWSASRWEVRWPR